MIQVWKFESETPESVWINQDTRDPGDIAHVAFSPDGQLLASHVGYDIQFWQAEDGVSLAKLEGHTWYIENVAFSPDGANLISTSRDGTIRLWGVPKP